MPNRKWFIPFCKSLKSKEIKRKAHYGKRDWGTAAIDCLPCFRVCNPHSLNIGNRRKVVRKMGKERAGSWFAERKGRKNPYSSVS
jgi:hypothetical protein